ncbi:sensor domain-containing diguanylate cyclase [Shewanella profunda]|uniref:diguanylate cyclase domain-containing protein n=1 Tax=Shewanella profunda TaxID=254793 RepID=UPI00200D35E2|nr:sensor domain-containing diguanylate cyclase [Shewanella profunda]MCL1089251.1 sensor domain-containing diguanylate cyclase [Shewanella profunda]
MASDTATQLIRQLEAEIAQLKEENTKLTALNRRAEEKLFAALDGNGLCLWEQHIPSGNLTIFNMRWGEMLGFSPEELAAHVDIWKSKLHPEDKEWVIKAFEDHVSGKADYYQAVHRMLHKDGSITWVSDRGRIVERLADGTPLRMMGSHIDITQEKRYQIGLAQLAHRDPLTNLWNRQAITKAFDELLLSGARGALMFIDLDGFKALNDRHGHKFGDCLLIHVANTLVSHAGESAQIARFGGDEFVILHPSSEMASLRLLAQSLLDVYRQNFLLDGLEVEIGLSIGIDIFDDGDSFTDSYERADAVMYQVKRQGKNGYCFYQPSES